MPFTTPCSRGGIVLVPFPFTDLSSSKLRPGLIVSPDAHNRYMEDLVLVAITSNLTGANRLLVDPRDCVGGSLQKTSAVKPAKVFTIHSSLIVKRLCALRPEKLNLVLAEIREFFS